MSNNRKIPSHQLCWSSWCCQQTPRRNLLRIWMFSATSGSGPTPRGPLCTAQALCPHKHPTSHTRPTKLYIQHRHSAHTNIPHLTPVPQNCTHNTGTLPTQTSHISHPSHKTVHTTQALCPHKHPTSHTRPTKLYTQHRHSAHTNIPHLTPVPQNCTHNTGTLPTQTSHISHPSHKTVQITQALCPHKHPTSHTRPTKLYTQHRHSAHTNIPHLTPIPQNCTYNTGTLPTQTSHISHPSRKTVHTTQALCPHRHPTSHTRPTKLYIQHRHSAHTNIPHLTPIPQNCTYNTGTLPTQTSHTHPTSVQHRHPAQTEHHISSAPPPHPPYTHTATRAVHIISCHTKLPRPRNYLFWWWQCSVRHCLPLSPPPAILLPASTSSKTTGCKKQKSNKTHMCSWLTWGGKSPFCLWRCHWLSASPSSCVALSHQTAAGTSYTGNNNTHDQAVISLHSVLCSLVKPLPVL